MVTSITRFPLPAGVSLDDFRKGLSAVAPHFQQPSGLQSKFFLISEDGRYGGGVYLWDSKDAAKAFEPVIRTMLQERMGVEAEITYFETPVVVDNRAHEIRQA